MKLLERELGVLNYAANQQGTLELPRNYAYRSLRLKLVANLTWTETTAGVVLDSAPSQLIRRVQVRANGRDVIKNVPFAYLHRAAQMRHGVRPKIVSPASTGALSEQSLEVHAVIDFAMWRAVKSIDILLDSSGMSTFDLIIDWGVGADIFGGAYVGAVTVNSASLTVASYEVVGVPVGTKFMTNKEYVLEKVITAANANMRVDLPVGNMFRSFILETVSDDVHVNTMLNNIKIQSGTEVFKNRIAGFLQRDNRLDTSVEWPVSTAAALGGADYANRIGDGWYLLEFVVDGRLTEALQTARLSSVELELDIAAPGTVDKLRIYPTEIIVPPQENA